MIQHTNPIDFIRIAISDYGKCVNCGYSMCLHNSIDGKCWKQESKFRPKISEQITLLHKTLSRNCEK